MSARRFASIAGTTAVTAIAAVGSYDHMRTLASAHGQPTLLAWLLPLSVDGMLLVSTLALADGRQHRGTAWLAFLVGVAASLAANVMATPGGMVARVISAWPAIALLLTVEVLARSGKAPEAAPAPLVEPAPVPAPVQFGIGLGAPIVIEPVPVPAMATDEPTSRRTYRPMRETLRLIEEIRAAEPDIEHDALAARLDLSPKRLRSIFAAQAA